MILMILDLKLYWWVADYYDQIVYNYDIYWLNKSGHIRIVLAAYHAYHNWVGGDS